MDKDEHVMQPMGHPNGKDQPDRDQVYLRVIRTIKYREEKKCRSHPQSWDQDPPWRLGEQSIYPEQRTDPRILSQEQAGKGAKPLEDICHRKNRRILIVQLP